MLLPVFHDLVLIPICKVTSPPILSDESHLYLIVGFIEHSYSLLFPPYAGRRGSGFRLLADYHDACKKRLLVRSVDRIPPCCPNSNWSLVMYLRCSGQKCRIRGFSVYRYLRPRSLRGMHSSLVVPVGDYPCGRSPSTASFWPGTNVDELDNLIY